MALLKAYRGVSPQLHRKAFAAETASLIGDIEIGEESSIWYGAVLRGDVGKIRIGARSNVQDLACIHMTKRLSDSVIGDEVTIGHSVIVHGAIIEDLCLIGMGAILMDNCRIGTGSIVGAGTLITAGTVIPPGSLVLGRPGRVVRSLGPSDLEDLRLSSRRYVALAAEHWGGAEFPDDIP